MTPSFKEKVTVVIPARNEVEMIKALVLAAQEYASQVIVVDGHSLDQTESEAKAAGAKVISDRGLGKGDAIRCAIPHIETRVVVFMDADGSHDPADIPKLVEPIFAGRAQHVSGSRILGGSSELHGGFDECFRLMGNAFFAACINWRFGVCLSESQNGFRAIETEILRKLNLNENITTIEQEMIIRTLALGYHIEEVPTHEHKRRYRESSIRLSRVWFRYIWSFYWNLLLRRRLSL
jgi:glycosyltransferase involved in cell wall biosynthesis